MLSSTMNCNSDDDDEVDVVENINRNFQFKYFSEDKLNEIVKRVQQDKRKELEELEWKNYVSSKEDRERLLKPNSSSSNESEESEEDECTCATASELQIMCRPSTSTKMSAGCGSSHSFQPLVEESCIEEVCVSEKIPISAKLQDVSSNSCKQVSLPRGSESSISMPSVASKTSENEVKADKVQQSKVRSTRNCLPVPSCKFNINSKISLLSQDEGILHKTLRNSENVMRIHSFWKKMDVSLDKIAFLFDKIPNPDDMADYNRRCKRAADFSSVFGRNYLYPLGRKISELHDRASVGHSSAIPASVFKQLVEAHQIAATALVSYMSHMPTSVVAGVPDKLQKLLASILDLCKICARFGVISKEGDATGDGRDMACNLVIKKCQGLLLVLEKKKVCPPKAVPKPRKQGQLPQTRLPKDVATSRKRIQNKTSPYLVTMLTKGTMAKAVKNLPRKRFGPPPPHASFVKKQPHKIIQVPVVECSNRRNTLTSSTSSGLDGDEDFKKHRGMREDHDEVVDEEEEEEEEEEDEDEEEEEEMDTLVKRYYGTKRGTKHNVSYATSTKSKRTSVAFSIDAGDGTSKTLDQAAALLHTAGNGDQQAVDQSVGPAIDGRASNTCQEDLFKRLLPVLSGMKLALSRQQMNESVGSSSLEELKYLLQKMDLPDVQQPSTIDSKSTKNEQNQQAKVVRVGSNNAQLIVLPAYDGPEPVPPCDQLSEVLEEESTRQCIILDIGSVASTFEGNTKQNHKGSHSLFAEHSKEANENTAVGNCTQTKGSPKLNITNGGLGLDISLHDNAFSKSIECPLPGSKSSFTDVVMEERNDLTVFNTEHPCTSDSTTALEISDQAVLSVLEYVNNYREFIKDIPIYKESVKPWRVIGRLSNQLVDDALKEVVKELEVEPLMSMMYNLEFQ